jgi:hypothetical protein
MYGEGINDLRERRCHVCGRRFIPKSFRSLHCKVEALPTRKLHFLATGEIRRRQHVYHKNGKWCCKWSCYTRLLDEIEANKKKTGRPEGYSPKKKKGTFASAAGGRESEQKGVAAVAEADRTGVRERRCGNGNRQRKKKGEEI